MKQTLTSRLAVVATALASLTALAASANADPAANALADPAAVDLSVVYVGSGDRAADFDAFLSARFTDVTVLNAGDVRGPELGGAADGDVLVVDANLVGALPAGFDHPMVVVSGPGVQTAESIGAKLDWL